MELQKQMSIYSSLKALQILTALAERESSANLGDIAKATSLSPSTVHRILQELMACGFVNKSEDAKKYKLGMEMMNLTLKVKLSDYLMEAAGDEMHRLNDLSLETIHLIAPDNDMAVYIGKLEAKNQIQLRSRVGYKIPLFCTGGGKLILAYQSKEWRERYLKANPLISHTSHTIINRSAFLRELDAIRKQGFSIDDREHNPDIVCIAAPIFGIHHGLAGTIGISAPDYRFPLSRALEFAEEVKKSGDAITKRIQK